MPWSVSSGVGVFPDFFVHSLCAAKNFLEMNNMKTSDSFRAWADWYRNFLDRQLPIDWNTFERIPPELKEVIGDSVRQFQLGESSEARNLKAKVARFVKKGGDKAYQDAMEWFIFEENRHSRLLGRFMDLEDMPKARSNFSDKLFRLCRHSVGLRYSLTILITAEIIAVPYYAALRQVSDSPILTTICKQILLDEANHIRFQAKAIRNMLQGLAPWRRKAAHAIARLLLEPAMDLVWFEHGRLFRAAGWSFRDFRQESIREFQQAWALILSTADVTDVLLPQRSMEPAAPRKRMPEVIWSDAHGI